MPDQKEIKQVSLEIQLDEITAQGQYVNMVVAQHSSSEFVLDFIFVAPGQPKAKVRSRIILAPEHAKRLHKLLGDNLANFERNFGEIKIPGPRAGTPMPPSPTVQ